MWLIGVFKIQEKILGGYIIFEAGDYFLIYFVY